MSDSSLASCTSFQMWDLRTKECIRTIDPGWEPKDGPVAVMDLCGDLLASGSRSGLVKVK